MATKNEVWVYEYDNDYPCENETTKGEYEITKVRYILGEKFDSSSKKALVCIGVNPSTAVPKELDSTLKRVQKYAKEAGEYNAWYMINVYPQRATNPKNMNKEIDTAIHSRNLEHIQALMTSLPTADIWCAWGRVITKKRYLKPCLKDIIESVQDLKNKSFSYVSRKRADGKKSEHPLHPIASVKMEPILSDFDIKNYLK